MLYNFIDANSKAFMGTTEDCGYRPLMTITKPLLVQYKMAGTFNASTAEFQHFDVICQPIEIKARIVTMYPADEEQTRLYNEHCDKLFRKG